MEVASLGCEPILAPLFHVQPVAWQCAEAGAFDAVAMTSANAARHGGAGLSHYTHLPLFAVGAATAQAARAVGFAHVETGASDAKELGNMLRGRVVHFAGVDHQPIPSTAIVTSVVVYESISSFVEALPPADIALVYSPRAGARLAALCVDKASMVLVAISRAAADASGDGWADVCVAAVPQEASILESLAKLCKAGWMLQPGSDA